MSQTPQSTLLLHLFHDFRLLLRVDTKGVFVLVLEEDGKVPHHPANPAEEWNLARKNKDDTEPETKLAPSLDITIKGPVDDAARTSAVSSKKKWHKTLLKNAAIFHFSSFFALFFARQHDLGALPMSRKQPREDSKQTVCTMIQSAVL